MSIIRERNIDLDEYRPQVEAVNFFGVDSVGGHLYNFFPVGPSLAVLPLVASADVACKLARVDLLPHVTGAGSARLESHVAAIVVALTVVVLFAALQLAGFSPGIALASVLIFAFCTSVWSTASRALWQHGPSMLALSGALYSYLQSRGRPSRVAWAGFFLACAWIIRPTNIVPLVLFAYLVGWHSRHDRIRSLVAALVPLCLFFVLNATIWHSPLPPYFRPSRVGGNNSFFVALAGNLVSPARGLFVFSPVLVVAVYGMVVALRNGTARAFHRVLIASVVLHWILISTFPHWWAGHSYGPRLFTDMMPYFAYFIAVALAHWATLAPRRRRAAWALTGLLAAASFWIQFRGANSYDVHWWNSRPTDVDQHPERVWDWHDLQFRR
jgi:hypothetical protein